MNKEQRTAIRTAEILSVQRHNFMEAEYKSIEKGCQEGSGSPCVGICTLDNTQHCKGCGRHVNQL